MSVGLMLALALFLGALVYFIYQVVATVEHNKNKKVN
jgi:hypothetical protein